MRVLFIVGFYLRAYPRWLASILVAGWWFLGCVASLWIVTLPCTSASSIGIWGGSLQAFGTAAAILGVADTVRQFAVPTTSDTLAAWWKRRPRRNITIQLSSASAVIASGGMANVTMRRNVDSKTATVEDRLVALEFNFKQVEEEFKVHRVQAEGRLAGLHERMTANERTAASAVAGVHEKVKVAQTGGAWPAVGGLYLIVFGTVLATFNHAVAAHPFSSRWGGMAALVLMAAAVFALFNRKRLDSGNS